MDQRGLMLLNQSVHQPWKGWAYRGEQYPQPSGSAGNAELKARSLVSLMSRGDSKLGSVHQCNRSLALFQ